MAMVASSMSASCSDPKMWISRQTAERFWRSVIICLRAGADATVALMGGSTHGLRLAFPENPISLTALFNYWRWPFSRLASAPACHEQPSPLDLSGVGAGAHRPQRLGRFPHDQSIPA